MDMQFVDAKTLAPTYSVTAQTILAWQRRGWIPCIRAGRRPVLFDPAEVEKALRDRSKITSDVGRPRSEGAGR